MYFSKKCLIGRLLRVLKSTLKRWKYILWNILETVKKTDLNIDRLLDKHSMAAFNIFERNSLKHFIIFYNEINTLCIVFIFINAISLANCVLIPFR